MAQLSELPGVGADLEAELAALGITTVAGLAAAPVDTLLAARGWSRAEAEALRAAARARVAVADESTRAAEPEAMPDPSERRPPAT